MRATVVQTAQPVLTIPAPAPAQTVAVGEAAVAPITAEPAAAPVESLSKTELMRRERVREEIRNEDAIQERLEELRLRDEKRRSGQILKGDAMLPGDQVAGPAAPQAPGLAPQDEVVVSPVTNHPGEVAPAPAPLNPGLQQTQAPQSVASAEPGPSDDEDKTKLYVRPLAGMSTMKTDASFNVKPHYTAGAALGIESSENLSFEVSYMYSDYGIEMGTSNPYVAQFQMYNAYNGANNLETLGLHQNVIEGGLKLALLNSQSKIRPFLGGGGGYKKEYANYAGGYIQQLDQVGLSSMTRDYESSGFVGYLATGVDVKVTKSLTLGGEFRYNGVLSSNENQQLPYNGFYTNPYWFGGLDADKRAVGASLAESAFYSITGTATFTF
jgi:hypothetical protein